MFHAGAIGVSEQSELTPSNCGNNTRVHIEPSYIKRLIFMELIVQLNLVTEMY